MKKFVVGSFTPKEPAHLNGQLITNLLLVMSDEAPYELESIKVMTERLNVTTFVPQTDAVPQGLFFFALAIIFFLFAVIGFLA